MIRLAQVLSWDHLVRQGAEPLAEGLELYGTERRQPFPSGFEVGRRSRGVEGCEHPYPGDFARQLGLDEERRHEEAEGDGKHEPHASSLACQEDFLVPPPCLTKPPVCRTGSPRHHFVYTSAESRQLC
jgi:hypothetical protein